MRSGEIFGIFLVVIIGLILIAAAIYGTIEFNKMSSRCAALCNDHRIISCTTDNNKVVASCADTSSPTGYVSKSQEQNK